MKHLYLPCKDGNLRKLRAGDYLLISGVIYTARDQAHQKLVRLINKSQPLPLKLEKSPIYYCGPVVRRHKVISCGPTTSSRMDKFLKVLFKNGLKITIGKGKRSSEARFLFRKYKAVYLIAPAGCGALLSRKILNSEIVAFRELGPEAIYRLEVKDFPVLVGIDAEGKDIYRRLEDDSEA